MDVNDAVKCNPYGNVGVDIAQEPFRLALKDPVSGAIGLEGA